MRAVAGMAGLGYRESMPQSFQRIENWADYIFDCPEGKWIGRLDNMSWGAGRNRSAANLILYFSEVGTDNKYWFSVFWDNDYCADDGGLSLRTVEAGAVLELTTKKTKTGKPRLMSAVKISD